MRSRLARSMTLLFATTAGVLASIDAARAVSCPAPLTIGAETLALPEPSILAGVADVNGDGVPDIVAITRQDAAVAISVFIGNGDGTFQPPLSTPLDSVPSSFVTGDFNGDGKSDVAVADVPGGEIFLSTGNGTFQDPIPFDVDERVNAMAAAKLDAEGPLDLLIAGNGLTVLVGNGDGTLQSPIDYSGPTMTGVTTGDFDGDGKLDVAVTSDNLVMIYPGIGNGSLGAPVSTVAGVGATEPGTSDVNGDGKLDLVLTTNGLAGVLIGHGDLTFDAARDYSPGVTVGAAIAADLDGDGLPELILSSFSDDYGAPGGLFILTNLGDGTFAPDSAYAAYGSPGVPLVGDLDGDGGIDVILSSGQIPAVTVYLNLGAGRLAAPGIASSPDLNAALAAGDFNEDGYLDLVIGTSGDDLRIAFGGPDGRFSAPPSGPAASDAILLARAATGDFNGDGHLDVVAFSNQGFAFFAGNGDGNFQPAVTYDAPIQGDTTTGLIVVDFNGDGYPDAAFTTSSFQFPVGQLTVFLGDGLGTFTLTAAMAVDVGLTGGLAAARFDADSVVDIVSAGSAPLGGNPTLFFLPRTRRWDLRFADGCSAAGHPELTHCRSVPNTRRHRSRDRFRERPSTGNGFVPRPGKRNVRTASTDCAVLRIPHRRCGLRRRWQTRRRHLGFRGAADHRPESRCRQLRSPGRQSEFGRHGPSPDRRRRGQWNSPTSLLQARWASSSPRTANSPRPCATSTRSWRRAPPGLRTPRATASLLYQWRKGGVPLTDGGDLGIDDGDR